MKTNGGNIRIKTAAQRFGLLLVVAVLICQVLVGVLMPGDAYGVVFETPDYSQRIKRFILVSAILEGCRPKTPLNKGTKGGIDTQAASYSFDDLIGSYRKSPHPVSGAINVSPFVDPNDDGEAWCSEALQAALTPAVLNKTKAQYLTDAYTPIKGSGQITATAQCGLNVYDTLSERWTYGLLIPLYHSSGKWYYDNEMKDTGQSETDPTEDGAKDACAKVPTKMAGVGVSYSLAESYSVEFQAVEGKDAEDIITGFKDHKWPGWFTPDSVYPKRLTDEDRYVFYNYLLITKSDKTCGADITSTKSGLSNEKTLSYVTSRGLAEQVYATADWNKILSSMPSYPGGSANLASDNGSAGTMSCDEVRQLVDKYASAYAEELRDRAAKNLCYDEYTLYNDDYQASFSATQTYNAKYKACFDGFKNSTDDNWCYQSSRFASLSTSAQPQWQGEALRNGLADGSIVVSDTPVEDGTGVISTQAGGLIDACLFGQGSSRDFVYNPDYDSELPETPVDCYSASGSMGWIACPIIDMLSSGIDAVMKYIDDSLYYQSLNNPEGRAIIRAAWSAFIPIANIAFAIVFLIIIYSTAIGGKPGGN